MGCQRFDLACISPVILKLATRRKVVVIPRLVNCHEIVSMPELRNKSGDAIREKGRSLVRRVMARCAEVCEPRGFFPRLQAYPIFGDNGGALAIEGRCSRRMRDCYGDSVAIAFWGLVPVGVATGARHA